MTRVKLVTNAEIRRVVTLAQALGLPIGAVDIRGDGVTIHPPQPVGPVSPGNAFDQWLQTDPPSPPANHDRPASH